MRRVPLPEVEKLPHILRLEVILVELHSVRVRQQVAQVLRPPEEQQRGAWSEKFQKNRDRKGN